MELPPFPAAAVAASPTHLRLGWSSSEALVEHPWGLPLLVAGATGSGKSTLAVKAIEQAVALGKAVVVLEMTKGGYDYRHLRGPLTLITESLLREGAPKTEAALRRLPPGSLVVVDYWDSLLQPPLLRQQEELSAFLRHRVETLRALLLKQALEGTTLLAVTQWWSGSPESADGLLKAASGRVLLGDASLLAQRLHLGSEVSPEHRKLLSAGSRRRGFGLYELAGRPQLLQC